MAARITARRFFSTTLRRLEDREKAELKKETKQNPELLVRHNIPSVQRVAGRPPAPTAHLT